mgnify:CR=1 FL=1
MGFLSIADLKTRVEVTLTPAQLAVLTLLSEGFGGKQMALHLGITESAVKARLSGARRKLAARTNTHAVAEALRIGLLKSHTGPNGWEPRNITDRGLVDPADATEIGMKIVEMADRCKSMDMVVPGATANWHFEADGVLYKVSLAVAKSA